MSSRNPSPVHSGYSFSEGQLAGCLDPYPGWTSSADLQTGLDKGSDDPASNQFVHDKRSLDQEDSSVRTTSTSDAPPPPPPTKRARQRKRISDPDADYLPEPQKTVLEDEFCDMDVQVQGSALRSQDPNLTPPPTKQLTHSHKPVHAPVLTAPPLPPPRPPADMLTPPRLPAKVAVSSVHSKGSDYDYAEDVDSEDELLEEDNNGGEQKDDEGEWSLTPVSDKPESPHTVWQNKRLQELVTYAQANVNKTSKPFKFSNRSAFGPVKELKVKLARRGME